MIEDLDRVLDEALMSTNAAAAVACVDVRSGMLMGMAARADRARAMLSDVALAASELCVAPPLDHDLDRGKDGPTEADAEFAVSRGGTHAFVRLSRRRDLVLVCVAEGSANVALLLSWAKEVARVVDGVSN